MSFRRKLCLCVFLHTWMVQVVAFDISGSKWLGAETDFYVDIDGSSATGISWNTAFIEAMADWNRETVFNFVLKQEHLDPCLDDGLNSVDFTEDVCGSEFGESALAVTLRSFSSQVLGPPSISESDIVINQAVDVDIFDGRLVQFGMNFNGLDFRRIALHELGHALGLDHEPDNAAIMAASIGNLDRLQADDILGVETLYGGLSNCLIQDLSFGLLTNALDDSDCTVQELTVGGGDTSFIDIYQFELSSTTELEFSMTASVLESVLLLADTNLQIISVDANTNDGCNSVLTETLQPGIYFLLANTFDIPPKEECGTEGDYQIASSFTSAGFSSLGSTTSLLGGSSTALFSGGITADNGLTYQNRFGPGDSLDITMQIEIDPQHQGLAGFLVVAALLEEQTLLLNSLGQFVDSAANPGVIVRAANRVLSAIEELTVATDLIPAELGIDDIVVDFIIGYGLSSEPEEIYFHRVPLNLTVSP